MEFEELIQPLKELEVDNKEIVSHLRMVDTLHQDALSLSDIILEFKKGIETDRHDEKKPFYSILLAYAFHLCGDTDDAIICAHDSAYQFNRQAKEWNHALSCWFLGLLLCKQGHIDKAKKEIENALTIVNNLKIEDSRLGYYDEKYKRLLDAINGSQIKTINQVLAGTSYLHTTTPTIPTGSFSEIIERLELPREFRMDERRMDIHSLRPSDIPGIDSQIVNINKFLEETGDKPPSYPFIYIFHAHCFNLRSHTRESQFQFALQHTWDAIKGFKLNDYSIKHTPHLDSYNYALSRWYLGLLYCNNGDNGSCRIQLEKAGTLFFDLQQTYVDNNEIEKSNKIQLLLDQINILFNSLNAVPNPTANQGFLSHRLRLNHAASNIPPQSQKTSEHKPTEPKTDNSSSQAQSKKQPGDEPPIPPRAKPPTENNKSHLRHIIIPVDMRAIENMDIDSTPLDPELFKQFQAYEEKKEHSDESGRPPEQKQNGTGLKRIVIPSFPNYGQATAGLTGMPHLDPSGVEKADTVDETLKINFEGKEHKVHFINSQTPPTFKEGKNYGWLKVAGESMNEASPVKINDKDHILFCERHDLESCAGKIVVAILPDSETQPPQLVIKYLLKLSSPMPLRTNGWNEYSKFMLHSESSLPEDPKTEMSYKKDMEITKDDQIVGEVIVVAKPEDAK